ncbi:hypothetical protein MPL1032_190121 [Mesorhizobium plurifarium]|uniref:Uncharacterized protein n=1 Tax=Mesorhizobium plurifarium TaxID=69974 RepID=A0A0K2VVJ9_MESPL|nr:hypothetical protein MPL1032_190121 [Mesorhizobium plurifarium]
MPDDTEDIANRIDQQLSEMNGLLTALIFISENVEDEQIELLRHVSLTLCHTALDKIAVANRDVTRLLRMAA